MTTPGRYLTYIIVEWVANMWDIYIDGEGVDAQTRRALGPAGHVETALGRS